MQGRRSFNYAWTNPSPWSVIQMKWLMLVQAASVEAKLAIALVQVVSVEEKLALSLSLFLSMSIAFHPLG